MQHLSAADRASGHSGISTLRLRDYTACVQKKVFWLIFIALSLLADFELPLLWGLLATIPIVVLSWWIAYRSEWFED